MLPNNKGTFLGCCIDFFGLRPGQTRVNFLKEEVKPLTDADRQEIRAGLVQNGYIVEESA